MYTPLEKNETRILALYPGKPGTPLRARLETVNIVNARRAQADYTNRTPEALGISSSQPSLYSLSNALDRYRGLHGEIFGKMDEVRLLKSKLSSLIEEYGLLIQKLSSTNGKENDQFGADAYSAVKFPSLEELHAEFFQHVTLSEERIEETYLNFMGMVDEDTYFEILRLSHLLTVLRYHTRDSLTWEAFDNGAFEALSYVWGDDYQSEGIYLDGQDESLPITTSLFQALQQLRLETRTRRIWIDALCINQSDVAERTIQLAMMSQIYRAATRVIVWLGCSDETTCLAFAALNTNLARDDYSLNSFYNPLDEACPRVCAADQPLARCLFCANPLNDACMAISSYENAVNELVSRSWFTRLWVVQEVASATSTVEVRCGSHRTHWRALRLNAAIDGLGKPFSPASVITAAAEFCGQSFSPSFLIWLLVQTAVQNCRFPCDRFFALQSITGIDVDQMQGVNADATPLELYTWLTGLCLTTTCTSVTRLSSRAHGLPQVPHVSILLALAPLTRSASDWPSWLLDLNQLPATVGNLLHEYSNDLDGTWLLGGRSAVEVSTGFIRNQYPISCLNQMQCRTSDCRKYLWIRGQCLGTVFDLQPDSVHPIYQQNQRGTAFDQTSALVQSEVKDWLQRCKDFVDLYLYDETHCVTLKEVVQQITPAGRMREYCCRMLGVNKFLKYEREDFKTKNEQPLTNGGATSVMPATSQEIFEACKEDLQDETGNLCATRVFDWTVHNIAPERRFGSMPAYAIRERKLGALKTQDETLVGWMPLSAELGDTIYLFKGAPRPFLLRKHTRDDSFTLLGDCWVHGMCEKEIADFCRDHEDSLVDVKLR